MTGAVRTAGAVILSGAMWLLSGGIFTLWPLAWLAPLPLLVMLPALPLGRAMLSAFAASAIGAVSWTVAYGALALVFVLIIGIPFTLVATVWRAVARRAHPLWAVVAYPALVVVSDFSMAAVSPHGTLGNIAYSQGDMPIVLQTASITGLWGVEFLLSLVAAALAMAWRHRSEPAAARNILAVSAIPIAGALVFGAVRLSSPQPEQVFTIGLAASDVDVMRQFSDFGPAETLPVVQSFADRAAALGGRGAVIVVLPEKFVTIRPEHEEAARAIVAAAARDHRVTIVAGFYQLGSDRRNLGVVFDTDGRTVLEYDKQHLVPGVEAGYLAGNTIGLLPIQSTQIPIGVAICKDLDFVPLGRAYAAAGVGLLLVPAWDFGADAWLHERMALVRSVEGGFAMARTATEGLLTVSDARGRVIAERLSNEAAEVMLTASVPVGPGGTFYSRMGDWFAWLCVALAAIVVGGVGVPKRSVIKN